MLLGWNLLRLLILLLSRLLRNWLLTLRRSLDNPTRARPGVEDFFPHRLGVLHFLSDCRRLKRRQAFICDHILRAIDRDVDDSARLIHPPITPEFVVRLLAKSLHRFQRELG